MAGRMVAPHRLAAARPRHRDDVAAAHDARQRLRLDRERRRITLLLDDRQQPVRQARLRPPLDRAGHALPARLDAIETLLQRFDVSVAHRFELGHFDVEVAAEGSVLGRFVVDLRREVVEVKVDGGGGARCGKVG